MCCYRTTDLCLCFRLDQNAVCFPIPRLAYTGRLQEKIEHSVDYNRHVNKLISTKSAISR